MIYVDSTTHAVEAFDFDLAGGSIADRRTLARTDETVLPDGLTLDEEDHIWVALWGGGAVHRYRPDGTLDRVMEVGTPQPTSVAFGGPDLADLYVTSAAVGLDADVAEGTRAGGLFRVRPGVRGRPSPPFRLG